MVNIEESALCELPGVRVEELIGERSQVAGVEDLQKLEQVAEVSDRLHVAEEGLFAFLAGKRGLRLALVLLLEVVLPEGPLALQLQVRLFRVRRSQQAHVNRK